MSQRAGAARRNRLVIFAKEPRPGRVKTRLGRDLGMAPAARWFRGQALGLLRRLGDDPRWETTLAVAPDREGLASRVWPAHIPRRPQGRGDLGARMGRVFREAGPGPVLIIGADIPGIGPGDIAEAFRLLGGADAVLGPAEDGGYWAIGLARGRRRAPAGLFANVRWSGPHALEDTRASLGAARIATAATFADVDDIADLRACLEPR